MACADGLGHGQLLGPVLVVGQPGGDAALGTKDFTHSEHPATFVGKEIQAEFGGDGVESRAKIGPPERMAPPGGGLLAGGTAATRAIAPHSRPSYRGVASRGICEQVSSGAGEQEGRAADVFPPVPLLPCPPVPLLLCETTAVWSILWHLVGGL